jgi:hypothetical protein
MATKGQKLYWRDKHVFRMAINVIVSNSIDLFMIKKLIFIPIHIKPGENLIAKEVKFAKVQENPKQ